MIGLLANSEHLSTANSGYCARHTSRMKDSAKMEKIEFGQRFSQAIDNSDLKGLSNAKMGKAFGLSSTTVWEFRNGDKMPSTVNGVVIAKRLKVSFEWLMTGRKIELLPNVTGLQNPTNILNIDSGLLTSCIQSAIDNIPDAPNKAKAIYAELMYEAKCGDSESDITETDRSNVINLMIGRVS